MRQPAPRGGANRRRAANLSVDASLLARARALGLNLSRVFEARLEEVVREHEQTAWLDANREALESYNRRVEEEGVFSDGLRRF